MWGFFCVFFWGGGWGSLQNWTILGVISIHFRGFKVKIQNGNLFWGRKISISFGYA